MKIGGNGILFALELSQGLFTLWENQLASDSAAHCTRGLYQPSFGSVSFMQILHIGVSI